MRRKPLSPRTQNIYSRILTRAFGAVDPPFLQFAESVQEWPESQRQMLRAAISRTFQEKGLDPEPIMRMVPAKWAPRTAVRIPTEEETLAYEKATRKLPAGRHAMALFPLAMGLRSEEILSLTRPTVKRGVDAGELTVMRKGGFEQSLPCKHARELLAELLATPSATGRARLQDGEPDRPGLRTWGTLGEVLSPSGGRAQYQCFHALVEATGRLAGLSGMRPHLLRHAFATRLDRDGATLPMIQQWLGHANVATTLKYVHPDVRGAVQYLRPFK